jgi:hypothetical protein
MLITRHNPPKAEMQAIQFPLRHMKTGKLHINKLKRLRTVFHVHTCPQALAEHDQTAGTTGHQGSGVGAMSERIQSCSSLTESTCTLPTPVTHPQVYTPHPE